MGQPLFRAIAEPLQLLLRTTGGPSDAGGGTSGPWSDTSGEGNDASLAGDPPTIVANPLGDDSGPAPLLDNPNAEGYAGGIDLTALSAATVFIAFQMNDFFSGGSGFYNFLGDQSSDGDTFSIYGEGAGDVDWYDGSSSTFMNDSSGAGGLGLHIYVAAMTTNNIKIYQNCPSPAGAITWDIDEAAAIDQAYADALRPQSLFYGCWGNQNAVNGYMLCGGTYPVGLTDNDHGGGKSSQIGRLFAAISSEVAGIGGDPYQAGVMGTNV